MSGVGKEPGCSWIDGKNKPLCLQCMMDHNLRQQIYEMLSTLEDLVKKKGYRAETQEAIFLEEYKEQSL